LFESKFIPLNRDNQKNENSNQFFKERNKTNNSNKLDLVGLAYISSDNIEEVKLYKTEKCSSNSRKENENLISGKKSKNKCLGYLNTNKFININSHSIKSNLFDINVSRGKVDNQQKPKCKDLKDKIQQDLSLKEKIDEEIGKGNKAHIERINDNFPLSQMYYGNRNRRDKVSLIELINKENNSKEYFRLFPEEAFTFNEISDQELKECTQDDDCLTDEDLIEYTRKVALSDFGNDIQKIITNEALENQIKNLARIHQLSKQ